MNRVLIIGLDGADPALMARFMAEGDLPHLSALARAGVSTALGSTVPPVTFPAWTTCVTGVNPGRHGIFDFTEMIPGQYGLQFINRTYRRSPAVWNMLSDAGKRVGVLGVPGTWPPEPVNGFMVSGFDSPVATAIDRSFVYPETLYPEVSAWRFADFQEHRKGPGWHDRARTRLLAKIADKEAVALRLFEKEPWDFFMVVFGESDTASHHFWRYQDPQSPRYAADSPYAGVIREVYQRLDEMVGRFRKAAGSSVKIMVVSDHGFTGAGAGVIHLNNFLAEQGYLHFTGASSSLLKTLALRMTPERIRGDLFRRFRTMASRAESRSRFAGIDWAKTIAYSEELSYFPSVRINLAGREPRGIVPPEEYEPTVSALCAALNAWPAIHAATPRGSLYHGPWVDHAPDILIQPTEIDGYPHTCLRARGGPSFRTMTPAEYDGGKEQGMNGVHRDPGIFIGNFPITGFPSLQDITPTTLAFLGVDGPAMDGRILWESPDSTVKTPETPAPSTTVNPYTPEEADEIAERLRNLGYLE